ncbi:hypothetical protein F5X96DRAFT_30708 [Biscogniauxia mediterranea]|nr:hypothetical protein F5X96DRAFT_30708 [Biscogniauxia mediterranea]
MPLRRTPAITTRHDTTRICPADPKRPILSTRKKRIFFSFSSLSHDTSMIPSEKFDITILHFSGPVKAEQEFTYERVFFFLSLHEIPRRLRGKPCCGLKKKSSGGKKNLEKRVRKNGGEKKKEKKKRRICGATEKSGKRGRGAWPGRGFVYKRFQPEGSKEGRKEGRKERGIFFGKGAKGTGIFDLTRSGLGWEIGVRASKLTGLVREWRRLRRPSFWVIFDLQLLLLLPSVLLLILSFFSSFISI